MKKYIGVFLLSSLLMGCAAGDDAPVNSGAVGVTTVKMSADFLAPILPKLAALYKVSVCPVPSTTDSPNFVSGMDCDGDGGIVRYLTPSSFKVAMKRLDFVRSDGAITQIIADTGTLANAQVLDLNSPAILLSETLPEGNYSSFVAELYYYEIVMPVDLPSVTQTLRVYLSDDNFVSEGSLGHHQGDITFVDAATGNELGWAAPGLAWRSANLLAARGATVGAGGTDPETTHLRGLYGDATLWNQAVFMQGANQDIFRITAPMSLVIGSTSQTVTFTFDVKDSWFFEDFDGNQLFNPCTGGGSEACAAGAEWSPLFYPPTITIQ